MSFTNFVPVKKDDNQWSDTCSKSTMWKVFSILSKSTNSINILDTETTSLDVILVPLFLTSNS